MTELSDFRNLSEEELKAKEETLRQELFNLNQQRYSGRVEKPHLFKQLRKDIARIETVLSEKTRGSIQKKEGEVSNSPVS